MCVCEGWGGGGRKKLDFYKKFNVFCVTLSDINFSFLSAGLFVAASLAYAATYTISLYY